MEDLLMANYKIQLRRDTAANWTSNNPTLAIGEVGIETNTKRMKVGDGSTAWTSLGYFTGDVTSTKIDDLTAGDNNTDLNVSSTKHGLMPLLTNTGYKFFKDDGTYVQGVLVTSGSLSAGTTNTISFYTRNPVAVDGWVTKVCISVTTGGGTGGSVLKVGIADDTSGTNLGSEFFTGLNLNATALYDSWTSGDTGAQTKWITLEDNASATDSYVVGKILTQNASSLVGKYYVFQIVK
jgi:hypothetical protein